MNPITAGVKAGWISFPVEVKEREMSRNLAQPAEAFDSGLAWRMWTTDPAGSRSHGLSDAAGAVCRL